jgi:hypothetical protein
MIIILAPTLIMIKVHLGWISHVPSAGPQTLTTTMPLTTQEVVEITALFEEF